MRGAPPRTQMKVYMDPRHKVSKPGGYKNWQRTTKLTLLPFLLTVTVQTEASNRSGVFPNENLSFSHREAVKQNDTGWVETQSILKKYQTWLGIWMFLCMPWVSRMQYGKNETWNKHIKPLTTVPLILCVTFAISFDFGTFLLRNWTKKHVMFFGHGTGYGMGSKETAGLNHHPLEASLVPNGEGPCGETPAERPITPTLGNGRSRHVEKVQDGPLPEA